MCSCAPEMLRLAASYLEKTHPESRTASEKTKKYVRLGASPRAGQHLLACARVVALAAGRIHVGKADIDAVAPPVLSHRIIPSYEAAADDITTTDIIAEIIQS